jgi:Tol biopolymer transport system component
MNADGSKDKMLVEGLTLSRWSTLPAWSYDGAYLAYSDVELKGGTPKVQVKMISSTGGVPTVVANPGQDPTWSPDGKWIAYQGGDVNADHATADATLSVIGIDGKGQRVITGQTGQTQYTFSFPQWSPDGLELAYQAFGTGGRDIFVTSLDGKQIRAIASQPTDENWPVWSPDGKRIAYDGPSSTPGMWQIALVDRDGANPVTLQHPPLGCNCGVRWSPDGTMVTAYKDGPVGHEDTGGSMLLVDVAGKDPVVAIPYTGLSNQQVSWQRLAP